MTTAPTGSPTGRPLGVLHGLWRYPVKSMAADSLEATEVSWQGLPGDRRWAFLRPDSQSSGFPFQTIRDHSRMCGYQPKLTNPERADASGVLVRTPGGDARYEVDDPALAAQLGDGVRVTRLKRGLFDAMPLSLISTATVAEACERAGVPYAPQRFRPNLLVEAADGRPFGEHEWVGRTLRVGDTVFRVDRLNTRCVIVDVDPAVGQPSGNVLRSLADQAACAGVYATVVTPGRLRAGDRIHAHV